MIWPPQRPLRQASRLHHYFPVGKAGCGVKRTAWNKRTGKSKQKEIAIANPASGRAERPRGGGRFEAGELRGAQRRRLHNRGRAVKRAERRSAELSGSSPLRAILNPRGAAAVHRLWGRGTSLPVPKDISDRWRSPGSRRWPGARSKRRRRP